MSIIVGYVPTPEGEAALERAIVEARRDNTLLVVINSSRGDAPVDKRYAQGDAIATIEERLREQAHEHDEEEGDRGEHAHGPAEEPLEPCVGSHGFLVCPPNH